MGDMIDDILGLKKEFDGMKSDFDDVKKDMSIAGGAAHGDRRGATEIWDPARFRASPRINRHLCLNACSEEAGCTECEDMCPVDALAVDGEDLSIDSEQCIGCGLCIAVCPTGALSSSKTDPKQIFGQVASNAVTHEMSYITCAQAVKHTPDDGVLVLPCIGCMKTEVWFALLAAYSNIGIYLPIGSCDRCSSPDGELLYTEAIGEAEQWARETVDYQSSERRLKTGKKNSAERQEFIRDIVKSTVTFAGNVNPATRAVGSAYRTFQKSQAELEGISKLLNKATGHAEGEERVRMTLDPNRQLMLSALKNYKDLAGDIRVILSVTTDECAGCGDCVECCPMGARSLVDGKAEVTSTYCVGCGLCAQVCKPGAAQLRKRKARVLLSEMTEMEKRIEGLKEKSAEMAGKLKDTAKGKLESAEGDSDD